MQITNLSQGFRRIVQDINENIDLVEGEVKREFSIKLARLIQQDMRRYIDRPRPETIAAIRPALSGQFGVRVQGRALEWLTLIIEGYTETDAFIPVLKNVSIDSFGNEPRGQLRRLVFDTDTFFLQVPKNGLERGIYRRLGNNSLRKLYRRVTQRRPAILPYDEIVTKHVADLLNNDVERIFEEHIENISTETFVLNLDLEV